MSSWPSVTFGQTLLTAASVGAMGLGLRSWLEGPVPFGVALGALAAYSGIVMAGVVEPRLEMFGPVLSRVADHPTAPRLALTFDDGPGPATARVLDALAARGMRATFFVIGHKLRGPHRAQARRAAEAGHGIACHSRDHDRFLTLRSSSRIRSDLSDALSMIEDATGVRTRWFRPPVGFVSPTVMRVATELGLRIVGFSARGYDGLPHARPNRVLRRLAGGLTDGAIVLLHDAAERDDFPPVVPDVLPQLLALAQRRGLAAVTLDELTVPVPTNLDEMDPT